MMALKLHDHFHLTKLFQAETYLDSNKLLVDKHWRTYTRL